MISNMEDDFNRFYFKNYKAAGVRVRKHMQELKEFAQSIRVEVQELNHKREKEKN